MNTSATEKMSRIERLLQTRKYQEALGTLAAIDRSMLSRSDYGHYCVLLAEASTGTGNLKCAHLLDEAIEVYHRDPDAEMYARAKYTKGCMVLGGGGYSEARELFSEAYAHYLKCNNLREAARALNRLAFISLHTGYTDLAVCDLERCADIYQLLDNRYNEAVISMNLACLYFKSGRLCDSIRKYSEVKEAICERDRKNLLVFYEMSAIPHALKGDITTARRTIAKCKPYLDKHIREKAIYYENLGLIELLAGRHDAAEKALRSGLEISLVIAPDSALISQIKRLLGDLHVAMARFERADGYAKEALAVAEKIGEREEIAACHRIFAQVEHHRGNHKKARSWYSKSTDLFDLIGSRYQLAVTRYLAATSGLYRDAERTAKLYYAQEYFESEGVGDYVKRIKGYMCEIRVPPGTGRKSVRECKIHSSIIVASPEMKRLVDYARRAAMSERTVLLTGATGTGKDLLAEYIHHWSGREGKFVPINAAELADTMIESELFGHKKGAYTGASDSRHGLFEQAADGTFYLDEIADASPKLQAKLLRVLETRDVRPVGENKYRKISFRLIAATNHDLQQRIRDDLFRPDLYYRLNEIPIHLPSLDEHKADIPALVEHFLTSADIDLTNGGAEQIEQLGKILSQRSWPGNVRELKNEVLRLWQESYGDITKMIPLALKPTDSHGKYQKIVSSLTAAGGNQSKAARMLGMSESTLRYWLKKYNHGTDTQAQS